MKITLPKSLRGLSLHQASELLEYLRTHEGEWNLECMCKIISIFSGIEIEQIKRADIDSVVASFKHIQGIMQREQKDPPKEVTFNGTTYVFNQDLRAKEWSAGRYIDSSNKSLELDKHPEMLAAICYVEKGNQYGDVPLTDRAEVMRKYFNGSDYIDLTAFFLQKFESLSPGYSILNLARAQNESLKALKIITKGG